MPLNKHPQACDVCSRAGVVINKYDNFDDDNNYYTEATDTPMSMCLMK